MEKIYNKVCIPADCENYIEWSYWGGSICHSCALVGESEDITQIPDECPNKNMLKNYPK